LHSYTVKQDEPDFEVSINLERRIEPDEISLLILEALSSFGLLHWKELIKIVKSKHMVSLERLQLVVRALVDEGLVVELPCRLFTLPKNLSSLSNLSKLLEKKIQDLGISRCSPPLTSRNLPFRVRIRRGNGGNKHEIVIVPNGFDIKVEETLEIIDHSLATSFDEGDSRTV